MQVVITQLLAVAMLFGMASCAPPPATPTVRFFTADNYPQNLSAWGLIDISSGQIKLPVDSQVYDLNTALFTDYALKLRTIYLPPGTQATYQEFEAFDFPVGSIISKTFFYTTNPNGAIDLQAQWDGNPGSVDLSKAKLIETRLLVRQEAGWDALPYIWHGEDARLAITGDLITLPTQASSDLNYLVPSRNQCAGCHATNHTSGENQPIGIKARHLNRGDPIHGENQLTAWQARGQLRELPELSDVPQNANFKDPEESLDHRARSYLDINCGHCHNEKGAADTSGLLLDYLDHTPGALGTCKAPIAAGRGSGGYLYSIVPGSADTSILTFRMGATDPGTMMPELGRTLVHSEGHELVSAWVDELTGECR